MNVEFKLFSLHLKKRILLRASHYIFFININRQKISNVLRLKFFFSFFVRWYFADFVMLQTNITLQTW